MAKPKHPTLRSLKQGQTIYLVINDTFKIGKPVYSRIETWFLHSDKTEVSQFGERTTRLSAKYLKEIVKTQDRACGISILTSFYYSRKRALTAIKEEPWKM